MGLAFAAALVCEANDCRSLAAGPCAQRAAIRQWVGALASASSEDIGLLEELLYGIYALVIVHLDAEEHIQRWDGHPSAA